MKNNETIKTMFDSIAHKYDMLNDLASLRIDKSWRKKAVRYLINEDNLNVLDVACGTGALSIDIAKAMKGGHITGVDLSEKMLAVMGENVAKEHLEEKISWQQGEGEHLNLPDNHFDRISVAFGIRNFEDREKGLKEMLRVLKPGGRLVILELSIPENFFIRGIFNLYFKHIVPFLGWRISGNKPAYDYLPVSVIEFPKKEEWMETMKQCGFSNVRHKALTFGICRMYTAEKQPE